MYAKTCPRGMQERIYLSGMHEGAYMRSMCVYITDLHFFTQIRGYAVREVSPGDDASGVALFQLLKHLKTRMLVLLVRIHK